MRRTTASIRPAATNRPTLARRHRSASIWATGYRPDYSWLDVPVLDRKGRIAHDGGVVNAPGMYVMGLPFLRRRKSSFIDGAADDAADLAAHLSCSLQRTAA
jgi:putative flavoprotein involved in K+ transport